MQERTANNKQARISLELQEYINELVKEVILNGKDFNSQKKWLKKYVEVENGDFDTLNESLEEFLEVLPEYKISNSKFIKKQVEILSKQCHITEDTFIKLHSWAGSKHGTFIDSRDGKTYKTIKIGNQIWMAENLNYTGSGIRHITDDKEWKNNKKCDGWCYYNNNASKGKIYGALYQWEAAKQACPAGWHLPSDAEWKELEIYLGMSQADANGLDWRGTDEGKKIKSTTGWNKNGNGNNRSGFTALSGGYRINNGSFYNVGYYGIWWSATENGSSSAYDRYLDYNNSYVNRYNNPKSCGFSVRCLRD